jgi:predicted DNA-binding protein (UPF0251 family)
MPQVSVFGPDGKADAAEPLLMTVEEYEVIRLIDWKGLSQEEAAAEMGVARSTVQRIYEGARRKLADCIVNGKTLKISGGDYHLCPKGEPCGCGKRCCPSYPDCNMETKSEP